MQNTNEKTVEDLVHISGDARRGVSVGYDLSRTALGKVVLDYRGPYAQPFTSKRIECEVYETGGVLAVHTMCPKCGKSQWISQQNKAIDYDRERGLLRIEPFRCTWEMGSDRQEFGFGMCGLRVAYDGRVVRDA